jgi:hypothetical protein
MKIKLVIIVIISFLNSGNVIIGGDYILIYKESIVSEKYAKDEDTVFIPKFNVFLVDLTTQDTLFKNHPFFGISNQQYHLYNDHLYYLSNNDVGYGLYESLLLLEKYAISNDTINLVKVMNLYDSTTNKYGRIRDFGASFLYDKLIVFLEVGRVGLDNEGLLFETYWQKIEVDLSTMETNESELIMVKDRQKMSID